MVCSMTRGPAKPMSALGSASTTSPSQAKLAATPPVVGCSITEMNGLRTERNRWMAAEVLAICMSEKMPSCIRAPPLELKTSAGSRRSAARSKSRATFSPTTDPIEPPMNSKAKAPTDTGWPPTVPTPLTKASRIPVLLALLRSRSR